MMEQSSRLDEKDSDKDTNDVESSSLEPILNEEVQEEEAVEGSYSPQLLHGDEEEDAFDPEEDRALIGILMSKPFKWPFMLYLNFESEYEFRRETTENASFVLRGQTHTPLLHSLIDAHSHTYTTLSNTIGGTHFLVIKHSLYMNSR
ncbi:putative cactin [Abeliophyllum distichum]|uniref:Cactin n=1 Tax=Abeliophyllum distichum TaxID=126358 RepID=A0ABD1PQN1_9LAMI